MSSLRESPAYRYFGWTLHLLVCNRHDLELLLAAWCAEAHHLSEPLTEEGTGQRRHERNSRRGEVSLVDADDLVPALRSTFGADGDGGPEACLVPRTGQLGRDDELGAGEAILELFESCGRDCELPRSVNLLGEKLESGALAAQVPARSTARPRAVT